MRKLGIATLFALGLGAALFWLLRAEPRGAAVAPSEAAPNRSPDGGGSPAGTARPDRTAEIPAAIEPVPEGPVAKEPAASNVAPDRLSGTLVAVDENGVEHAAEDGRFELWLVIQPIIDVRTLEVEAGSWSVELPEGAEILGVSAHEILLGGRPADPEWTGQHLLDLPSNGWLELRAHWAAETLLHVRDASSGLELAPVLLVDTEFGTDSRLRYPSVSSAPAQDVGASPIRFEPGDAEPKLWRAIHVRSPGYAWSRTELDLAAGGERFLDLDPGGDLTIELRGDPAEKGALLRVRSTGFEPFAELPLRDRRELSIEGVPAGVLQVGAEIGDRNDPVVLGEARATVVAGEASRVVLEIRSLPPVRLVPFSGSLELSEEWGLDRFRLSFRCQGPARGEAKGDFSVPRARMRQDPDDPGTLLWSAPDAQPGRYEVGIEELAFIALLELPDGGTSTARVAVPPPCDVVVACVDVDTGLPADCSSMSWNPSVPGDASGWIPRPARRDPQTGRWEFRAPIGRIEVFAAVPGYHQESWAFQVVAGRNELEFRVARRCGLRPVLRDGARTVSWEKAWRPKLVPLDGQEESAGAWSMGGPAVELGHREPGRYRLVVPRIPGYEPVPDEVVVLETGVVKEHVIELRRER